MPFPFAAVRSRIFIPVSTAYQVWSSIAVHINGGDALGMIATQAMNEERSLGNSAGAGAAGFEFVLRECNGRSQRDSSREAKNDGSILHGF
jgi:hypothetical protein